MKSNHIIYSGKAIADAKKVLILLHGRGADAQDILSVSRYLSVNDFAMIAPEAFGNSWYPYSFLAPAAQNEPALSNALQMIDDLVKKLENKGIKNEQIYFAGFSQGACLALEYTARNAGKWGGVVAFTGGLIGDKIYAERYTGDFQLTPVFIGTSDPDPHVPVDRVNESVALLKSLNAVVVVKIYPRMGHTINEDVFAQANKHVFKE